MSIDFYDLIQEKVWSQGKRDNLIGIFENEEPGHYEKLHFCGFLINVLKLSPDVVFDITCNQSAWLKKDPHRHWLNIRSVVKSITQRNRISNGSVISESRDFLTVFDNFEITETNEKTNTVKKYPDSEITSKRTITDFEPKSCQIGHTHVTCYFKKCNQCSLTHGHIHPKNIGTGGEKNG